MGWMEFVSAMTGHIAWSAAVVALALIFRRQLAGLVGALDSWEGFGQKFTFSRRLARMEKKVGLVTGSVYASSSLARERPAHPSRRLSPKQSDEQSAEPSDEDPALPSDEEPTWPSREEPTRPSREEPTRPSREEPTWPSREKPVRPSREQARTTARGQRVRWCWTEVAGQPVRFPAVSAAAVSDPAVSATDESAPVAVRPATVQPTAVRSVGTAVRPVVRIAVQPALLDAW